MPGKTLKADGLWYDKDSGERCEEPPSKWEPGDGAPLIISDEMDRTQNVCDGKYYDSKRAFAKATRDAGCVEVGNEKMNNKRKELDSPRDEIIRALN